MHKIRPARQTMDSANPFSPPPGMAEARLALERWVWALVEALQPPAPPALAQLLAPTLGLRADTPAGGVTAALRKKLTMPIALDGSGPRPLAQCRMVLDEATLAAFGKESTDALQPHRILLQGEPVVARLVWNRRSIGVALPVTVRERATNSGTGTIRFVPVGNVCVVPQLP